MPHEMKTLIILRGRRFQIVQVGTVGIQFWQENERDHLAVSVQALNLCSSLAIAPRHLQYSALPLSNKIKTHVL